MHNCTRELQEAKLKVTPARLGVLAALEESDLPLDIKDIIRYLRIHKIKTDRVTVFRIIKNLVKYNLAVPIQLNEGKFRYEHSGKADHHHFVCGICGVIKDIHTCNVAKIEEEMERSMNIHVKKHSLEFYGLCERCQP